MKLQQLAFLSTLLGVAVSHPHLHPHHPHLPHLPLKGYNNTCPVGYTMSVTYITVTNTISSAVQQETSSSSSSIMKLTSESTPPSSTQIAFESSSSDDTMLAIASSATSTPPAIIAESAVITPAVTHAASSAEETIATSTSIAETTSSVVTTSSAIAVAPSSASSSSTEKTSGEATYFGGDLDAGDCSFIGYTLPSGIFGTALSVAQWDTSANCGACVAIKGPDGNTIKAMIVDKCPSCAADHFDLFTDAFSSLAALGKGVIDIEWAYTSCGLDTPLKLKNKSGSSQWWFSMQVVNTNEAVTALEVSTDSGSTWQSTTRTDYNFFQKLDGFGTDTVDVRVTGKSGKVVVVKDVTVSSESETTASSNL